MTMFERQKRAGALFLLAALAAAMAAAFSAKAYRGLRLALVAGDWPAAEATVVGRWKRDEVFYRRAAATAVVEYTYLAGGEERRGEKKLDSEEPAVVGEFLEKHPLGGRLTVHYNPDDPAESAIDPSFRSVTLLHMVIALAGAFLAAALIPATIKALRGGDEDEEAQGE